jgi:uncharacterized protein involved in exopolysaccharide biosynthesis
LTDLRGQIAATPEENTTLINITATAREPNDAARMATAVAQAYQQENGLQRSRKIVEARRFIEEQLRDVTTRLHRAEDGIRSLKEARGFVSITDETTASMTRLTSLETEHDKIRRDQEEVAGQIQALQNPLARTVPTRMLGRPGPRIAKLTGALMDLNLSATTSSST